jgi:small subunit ribosomal protein S12
MTTINQLLNKKTIRKKKLHRKNTTALQGNPQKKAICTSLNREKPKKPNSALRKVLKVFCLIKKKVRRSYNEGKKSIGQGKKKKKKKLKSIGKKKISSPLARVKKNARIHAPGEMPLNHFAKFQRLLMRGCRVRDLPGVRYRVILGKLDIKAYYGPKPRNRKRSKFSLKKVTY